MFKTLVKKQLAEIGSGFFTDKKTGKKRSKKGIVIFSVVFALLFLYMSGSFFFGAKIFCEAFYASGNLWAYFSFVGLAALALGVFGGVFTTYASVYRAKDNELLLSMPIPPFKIIAARIMGVLLSGFLYESVIYIPALIARAIVAPISAAGAINALLLWAVLGVLITVITLALGWLVAAISSRLKHKTFVAVFMFLVLFAAYYYVVFKAGDLVSDLAADSSAISDGIKTWVYPFYAFGIAAEGNFLAFVGFAAATAVLALVAIFVLSKTFFGIVAGAKTAKKAEYKEKAVKSKSAFRALTGKEFKRLFSSATILLNCSVSAIMGVVFSVLLLLNRQNISALISSEGAPANAAGIICMIGASMCFMLSAMNNISGASVALDAKTIDIMRAMPVSTKKILSAKQATHIIMTVIPTLILCAVVGFVMNLSAINLALLLIDGVAFTAFGSAFSLAMGLKFPNMKWTNETVAVKQGAGNMIVALGGIGIASALGGGLCLLNLLLSETLCFVISAAMFTAITVAVNAWIYGRGVNIFERL
ncbi:MAG: hypothetical protein IJU83_02385 [Clostridia bacterium]|nr:hypothetical protein [Clostridia bacterium]